MVKIGDDGHRPGRAQFGAALGAAGHRKQAKALAQQRKQAHADVAAANDQQTWERQPGVGMAHLGSGSHAGSGLKVQPDNIREIAPARRRGASWQVRSGQWPGGQV